MYIILHILLHILPCDPPYSPRYQGKGSVRRERVYYEAKRAYVEARGGRVAPDNSRPARLREALGDFEVGVGCWQGSF